MAKDPFLVTQKMGLSENTVPVNPLINHTIIVPYFPYSNCQVRCICTLCSDKPKCNIVCNIAVYFCLDKPKYHIAMYVGLCT